jgi:hypothetical protein
MSSQHQGSGGGGSSGGGGGGKNDRGAADDNVADTATRGGISRHLMWREEQIEQFVYLIRSRKGKWQWVMNDYEFNNVCNPTTAEVANGNKDDGKNGGNNNDNRQTSSAGSDFIVRILFHTLLLLA